MASQRTITSSASVSVLQWLSGDCGAVSSCAEAGERLVWNRADKLGVDKQRIILAGDSVGGHLALTTALRLKASGEWLPHRLLLIYPMLDATASHKSYTANDEDYVITHHSLLSGYEMYLPDVDPRHPEASSLWRDDFGGLPALVRRDSRFLPAWRNQPGCARINVRSRLAGGRVSHPQGHGGLEAGPSGVIVAGSLDTDSAQEPERTRST